MKRIYFDNAATTPLAEEVIETMAYAMRDLFGNPSSIYTEGRTARAAIEQARKQIAQCIGASIGEVFFTSGGTESNNMALKCAVRDLGVERIISSPIEHHCVLHSLDSLERLGQIEREEVRLDSQGHPDMEQLEQLLKNSRKKTLASLMHSNNEVGAMIGLQEVAELCREHGALFHSDTVQTMGYYPIDVSRTPASFLSGSAHKFYGPKGTGFIYINSDNIIRPYIDGGGQERNMRAGTENIYGILGLAKALQLACDKLEERRSKVTDVRNYMKARLEASFDNIQFNGDPENGHYKLLSVAFPPSEKADLLLLSLDIAGVSVSGGSACSSGADAGSHVIEALKGDPQRKTIRFSFSHNNTREEVDFVIARLKEILPAGAGA